MTETKINPVSEISRANVVLLLDFYGNALTEKQRQITELYFQEDLSLAEIAELLGITRQGVRDGLKKAEKALLQMEDRLGIAERFLRQKKALNRAIEETRNLPETEEKKHILALLESALRES